MKITEKSDINCEICARGKMVQFKNKLPDKQANKKLHLVHCGIACLIEPISLGSLKYSLSFVEVYSGLIMVYFL